MQPAPGCNLNAMMVASKSTHYVLNDKYTCDAYCLQWNYHVFVHTQLQLLQCSNQESNVTALDAPIPTKERKKNKFNYSHPSSSIECSPSIEWHQLLVISICPSLPGKDKEA